MSCTYIDLSPMTPDDRYIQPLNVGVLPQPLSHLRPNCPFRSINKVEIQGQLDAPISPAEEPSVRQHVEVQQRYVENLRQEMQLEQRRAESELQREQAHLRQQHSESEHSFNSHREMVWSTTKLHTDTWKSISLLEYRHIFLFSKISPAVDFTGETAPGGYRASTPPPGLWSSNRTGPCTSGVESVV